MDAKKLAEEGDDAEGAIQNASKLYSTIKNLTKTKDNPNGVSILTNTGEFRSTYEILLDISKVWKDITDSKQAALLEKISGKNRANVASAILQSPDVLEEVYKTSTNAEGSTEEAMETALDSIESRVKELNNAVQTMWQNAVSSDFLKYLAEISKAFVNLTDNVGLFQTILAGVFGFIAAKGGGLKEIGKAIKNREGNFGSSFMKGLKGEAYVQKSNGGKEVVDNATMATKAESAAIKEQTADLEANKAAKEANTEADKRRMTSTIDSGATTEANSAATEQNTIKTVENTEAKEINSGATEQNTGTTVKNTEAKGTNSGAIKKDNAAAVQAGSMVRTAAIAIADMAIFMTVIKVIEVIIDKIKEQINYEKELDEKVKKTNEDLTKRETKYKDNSDYVKDNVSKYRELAKGVDEYGNNISLTNSEFDEYNSISNEIAERFPSLVKGYTSTGDAILKCKDNVALLNAALSEDNGSVLQDRIDSLDDTVENIYNKNSKETIANWKDFLGTMVGKGSTSTKTNKEMATYFKDHLKKMDNGEKGLVSNQHVTGKYNTPDVKLMIKDAKEKKIDLDIHKLASGDYEQREDTIAKLEKYITAVDTEARSNLDSLDPILEALVKKTSDHYGTDITGNTETAIISLVKSIDEELFNKFEDSGTSYEEYIAKVIGNIADDSSLQDAIKQIYTLDSDDLPVAEILETGNKYGEIVAKAFSQDGVKVSTEDVLKNQGIDVDSLTEELDNIQSKLGEHFQGKGLSKWINSLKKDDLDELSSDEYMNRLYQQTANIPEVQKDVSNKYSDIVSDYQKAKEEYDSKEKDKDVSSDVLDPLRQAKNEAYEKVEKTAKKAGMSVDDFVKYVEQGAGKNVKFTASLKDMKDALTNLKSSRLNDLVELADSINDIDTLTESVKSAVSAIDTLKTAMSEQNSTGYITTDTYDALLQVNENYAKCLDTTSNGIALNAEKARALTQADNEAQLAQLKLIEAMKVEQYQINTQKIDQLKNSKDKLTATDKSTIKELKNQNEEIKTNIQQYNLLENQLTQATSAFNQWQAAQSGGEAGDEYTTIQSSLEDIEILYKRNLIGTEKFKTACDMLFGEDFDVSNFKTAFKEIKRYFTDGSNGVNNFVKDLAKLKNADGTAMATVTKNGAYKINIKDDKYAQKKLGITQTTYESLLGRLKDYGADIKTNNPEEDIEQLPTRYVDVKSKIKEYKEKIEDKKGLKDLGIKVDTSDDEKELENLEKEYNEVRDKLLENGYSLEDIGKTLNSNNDNVDDQNEKLTSTEKITSNISNNVQDIKNSWVEVADKVREVNEELSNMPTFEYFQPTADAKKTKKKSSSYSTSYNNIIASGKAHVMGKAYASGNASKALVGELGEELKIDGKTGTWSVLGANGAEFANVGKDDIIFNHKQTKELLSKGATNSRGKTSPNSSLKGKAFASGTTNGIVKLFTKLLATDEQKRATNKLEDSIEQIAQAVDEYKQAIVKRKEAEEKVSDKDKYWGNVNQYDRTPVILTEEKKQEMVNKGLANSTKEIKGNYMTTYGMNSKVNSGKLAGQQIMYTPLLPDGTILSRDTLDKYINKITKNAGSKKDVMKADKKGLKIGNQFINGIINDVTELSEKDYNKILNPIYEKLSHVSVKKKNVKKAAKSLSSQLFSQLDVKDKDTQKEISNYVQGAITAGVKSGKYTNMGDLIDKNIVEIATIASSIDKSNDQHLNQADIYDNEYNILLQLKTLSDETGISIDNLIQLFGEIDKENVTIDTSKAVQALNILYDSSVSAEDKIKALKDAITNLDGKKAKTTVEYQTIHTEQYKTIRNDITKSAKNDFISDTPTGRNTQGFINDIDKHGKDETPKVTTKETTKGTKLKEKTGTNKSSTTGTYTLAHDKGSSTGKEKSSKSSSKNQPEVFDFIERRLDKLQKVAERAIDKIAEYISDKAKKAQITLSYQKVKTEYNANNTAYRKYMNYAEKHYGKGLDSKTKREIKGGTFDIRTIKNDKLKERIQNYQTYYDKAQDCIDANNSLRNTFLDLAQQWAQLPIDSATKKIEKYSNAISVLDSRLSNLSVYNEYSNSYASNKTLLNKKLKQEENTLAARKSENSTVNSNYSKTQKGLIKAINNDKTIKKSKKKTLISNIKAGKGVSTASFKNATTLYKADQYNSAKDAKATGNNEYRQGIQDFIASAQEIYDAIYQIPLDQCAKRVEKLSTALSRLDARLDRTTNYTLKKSILNSEIDKTVSTMDYYAQAKSEANKNKSTIKSSLSKTSNLKGATSKEKAAIAKALKENKAINISTFTTKAGIEAATKWNSAITKAKQANEDYEQGMSDGLTQLRQYSDALYQLPIDKATEKVEKLSKAISHLATKTDLATTSTTKGSLIKEQESKTVASYKETVNAQKDTQRNYSANKGNLYSTIKNSKLGTKDKENILGTIRKGTDEVDVDNVREKLKKTNKYTDKQIDDICKKITVYNSSLKANETAVDNMNDSYDNAIPSLKSLADAYYNLPIDECTEKVQKLSDALGILDKRLSNTNNLKSAGEYIADMAENYNETYNKKLSENTKASINFNTAKNTLIGNLSKFSTSDQKLIKEGMISDTGKIDISAMSSDLAPELAQDILDYNSALEAKETASNDVQNGREDLISNLRDLGTKATDKIVNEFDKLNNMLESKLSLIDASISTTESKGYKAGESYYIYKNEMNQKELSNITGERDQLNERIKENLRTGLYTMDDQQYYDDIKKLDTLDEKIETLQQNIQKNNDAVRQLKWDQFDDGIKKINELVDECEFLNELISDTSLTDDYGLTNEGYGSMGLRGTKYNTELAEAKKYEEAIAEINAQLANDPNNQTLIERKNSLVSSYRECIKAAQSEKQAVIDLVQKGYDAQINSIEKLTDKQKKLLQAEQNLHNYRKSVADQEKNIVTLKKQISALANSTDRKDIAQRLKLEKELQEKEDALQEDQYSHNIETQENALDDAIDSFKERVEEYMKDTEQVFTDATNAINNQSDRVLNGIEKTATKAGTTISNELIDIWNNQTPLNNYGNAVQGTMTGIQKYIGNVTASINAQYDAYNKLAASITSAMQAEQAKREQEYRYAEEDAKNSNAGQWGIVDITDDNNVSDNNTNSNSSTTLPTITPDTIRSDLESLFSSSSTSSLPNVRADVIKDTIDAMKSTNGSGAVSNTLDQEAEKNVVSTLYSSADIAGFIKKYGKNKSSSKKISEYSDLNQYIYKKKKKVLTVENEKKLAKLVGVDTSKSNWKTKTLTALKKAKFSEGGTFDLQRVTGEDGIALVKRKEGILSQAQMVQWNHLIDNLTPLNDAVNYSIDTLKDKGISNRNMSVQAPINVTVEGNLDNVTLDQLNKAIKDVPNMLVRQMNKFGTR